jgi:hypothetical protein
MRAKVEEEFRSQFNIRQNTMWSKFLDESQLLASQHYDLRTVSQKKDSTLYKLSKVIAIQESQMTKLSTQLHTA